MAEGAQVGAAIVVLFGIINVAFLVATGVKFLDGAWFPVVGVVVFTILHTWRRGRVAVKEIRKDGVQARFLPARPDARAAHAVPGTAIFLIAQRHGAARVAANLKHNKVLHDRNVCSAVERTCARKGPVIEVEAHRRQLLLYVYLRFMEVPDAAAGADASCDMGESIGIPFDPMDTTYFASRETIVAGRHRGMPVWRDRLFAFLHRNAAPATGFFRIPGNRLVELGAQVEI